MYTLVNLLLPTGGDGLYSPKAKIVNIHALSIATFNCDDEVLGNLQVYFTHDTWNTSKDSIIYTDKLFLEELSKKLKELGIEGNIYYSECGAQTANYVDFDVDEKFVESFTQYARLNHSTITDAQRISWYISASGSFIRDNNYYGEITISYNLDNKRLSRKFAPGYSDKEVSDIIYNEYLLMQSRLKTY